MCGEEIKCFRRVLDQIIISGLLSKEAPSKDSMRPELDFPTVPGVDGKPVRRRRRPTQGATGAILCFSCRVELTEILGDAGLPSPDPTLPPPLPLQPTTAQGCLHCGEGGGHHVSPAEINQAGFPHRTIKGSHSHQRT